MLPKFQLSIHDVRPSNQKRVRSPNKANVGIYQTPKPLEKRMKAEGAIRKIPCDLDDSVMELNSYGAMSQTFSGQEMESPGLSYNSYKFAFGCKILHKQHVINMFVPNKLIL